MSSTIIGEDGLKIFICLKAFCGFNVARKLVLFSQKTPILLGLFFFVSCESTDDRIIFDSSVTAPKTSKTVKGPLEETQIEGAQNFANYEEFVEVKGIDSYDSKTDISQPRIDYSACFKLNDEMATLPAWIQSSKIFITKIIKKCDSGAKTNQSVLDVSKMGTWFRKDSPMVAMGVPCTGGYTPAVIVGKSWQPKAVELVFSNDCSMENSKETAANAAKTFLGQPGLNLIAFNPASIIYWDMVDYKVAGQGYTVAMHSPQIIGSAWKGLQAGGSINIRFLAKESSWYGSQNVFLLEGKIVYKKHSGFKFEIEKASIADELIIEDFVEKCRKIRSPSGCKIQ